ncbi:MAG: septal ring lytic transglycosylase RlpA family protein [Acidimicrobiales bacterium]
MTLVAGLVCLGNPPGETSTAVRASSTAGTSPLPGGAPASQTAAAASAGAVSVELAQDRRLRATTSTIRPSTTVTTPKPATTTTSAPATTTTSLAVAPSGVANPLTPLTTLLAQVVPPAVAVAGALTRSDSGVASWFDAPDATCAHRTLPLGTIVTVTRNHNGASATCRVNDRGPTLETGRLIDLSLDTFEKLAASEAGLIDVRIEW